MKLLTFSMLFLISSVSIAQSDPILEISGNQTACVNDTVTFEINTNLLIEQILEWNFNDPNSGSTNSWIPSHAYSIPGTYQVSCILQVNCGGIIDINNPITVPCFYYDTLFKSITISACDSIVNHSFLEITNSQSNCQNDLITFGISSNLVIEQILGWNFDDPASNALNTSTLGMPSHVYSEPGTYQVSCVVQINCGEVFDINNPITAPCFYYDTIYTTITIIDCASTTEPFAIYIPNTFTPNDGGMFNNIFKVEGNGIDPTHFKMKIFNRWGELIFISDNPLNGWDGCITETGIPAPIGVYTYSVIYRLINQEINKRINGHVNLIR